MSANDYFVFDCLCGKANDRPFTMITGFELILMVAVGSPSRLAVIVIAPDVWVVWVTLKLIYLYTYVFNH